MISTEINGMLKQLKLGEFDPSQADQLERLSPDEFISDLKVSYPVVFQERQIRDKHEIGMARKISLETVARKIPGSNFFQFSIFPSIKNCVLASYYASSLSEITVLSEIRVRPRGGPALDVNLKMGHGYKLDKTPDGWFVKQLTNRSVTLSESFLLARGWKFEVFGAFSNKR
jgi:hypothetical protein